MHAIQLEHDVRDFDAWKATFDDDPLDRKGGGVRSYRVSRPVEDSAYVVVELEFDTRLEAEAFLEKLLALWRDAGPRLGFESPRARIVEVVESASV